MTNMDFPESFEKIDLNSGLTIYEMIDSNYKLVRSQRRVYEVNEDGVSEQHNLDTVIEAHEFIFETMWSIQNNLEEP